jgi:cell division protein FtsB
MTKSDSEEVTLEPCSSCIKTEHLFDNLLYDYQITNQKNSELKNEILKITKERDFFKNEIQTLKETIANLKTNHEETFKPKDDINLQKENNFLKQNVSTLEKDLSKFVTSTKTLEKIMGSQIRSLNKSELGSKQKLYKDFFGPPKEKKIKKLFCSYCHTQGHKRFFCYKKTLQEKRDHSLNNLQRKNQRHNFSKPVLNRNTNSQGPKSVWVPKVLLTSNAGVSSNNQEKALVLGQWMLKAYDWRQTKLSIF